MCRALHDDDLFRLGDHTTGAAEMIGERRAQGVLAAVVPVVERRNACAARDLLCSGQPAVEWKERHVRCGGSQVIARHRCERLRLGPRRGRTRDGGDYRCGPGARDEEALRLELPVGVPNDTTGDSERLGQHS